MMLLCLLIFPLFLMAQDAPQSEVTGISTDLGIGNWFKVEQVSVKFIKVISDSRCPRQVNCIWPGEAKVLLGITENGEYFEKEVIVSGSGAEFLLSKDLQILVAHLRPYPETGKGIPPEEYCLRLAADFEMEDQ